MKIVRELDEQAKKKINSELYFFNVKHFPDDLKGRYEEVNLFVKDENEEVVGGLLGEICWNWLEIHVLIVDETLRKSGVGSKLIEEAEKIARDKKCDFIKVDTLSFQAKGFYEKHGFKVFGSIDNVGREFIHYYLRKELG